MKTPICLLLVAATFLGCLSALQHAGAAEPKAAAQGTNITKKAGETFTISLPSNETTGYSWALDGKIDSAVTKVSNDYVAAKHAPGIAGSGGTEHWKFRAEKKGTATLHFSYRRPWEKSGKPAEERTFKVIVE